MAFLRRDHSRRRPRRIPRCRNGDTPKIRPTGAGRIPVQVPQVRETREPIQSRLLRFLAAPAQQHVLQRLVTEMDARGLPPGHRRRRHRCDRHPGANQVAGQPPHGDAVDRF
jgi:hypothetical protein